MEKDIVLIFSVNACVNGRKKFKKKRKKNKNYYHASIATYIRITYLIMGK